MRTARGGASTLTALSASGAATAAAVTVDSDRASRNRPRPAESRGRSEYNSNPNLGAIYADLFFKSVSSRCGLTITGCGIDNPNRFAVGSMTCIDSNHRRSAGSFTLRTQTPTLVSQGGICHAEMAMMPRNEIGDHCEYSDGPEAPV
jgi:hypothetical protein